MPHINLEINKNNVFKDESLQIMVQSVYEKIEEYLPKDWTKCCFYVGYTNGSYTMNFYVKNKDEKYTDSFNLNINDNDLTFLFMDIDDIISPERNKLNAKNKWNVLTIIIDSKANVKIDLDYTDISECSIDYFRNWIKNYLN